MEQAINTETELLDLNSHLSPRTTVDFSTARHLLVSNHEKDIPYEHFGTIAHNITFIEFSGPTSYRNIKILLSRCPNLRSLSFVNFILVNYSTDYRNFFIIQVPRVRELRFIGSGKLSLAELHAIDFLYRRVRFQALKSLAFLPSSAKGKKSKATLINKAVRKITLNERALSNFLIQNRESLKEVVIKRCGIPLNCEAEGTDNSESENLAIQIDSLTCDPNGPGALSFLSHQDRLLRFSCSNGRQNFTAETLEAVYGVIRRCAVTLREVSLTQIIRIDFKHEEAGDTKLFHHDCSVYKYCQNLQRLHIKVTQPDDLYVSQSNGSKVGVLLNPRFVPELLKSLVVKFDYISPATMELFIGKLTTMIHLSFLVIHGNAADPFKLKSTWIIALTELPEIEVFELAGCKMEEDRAIETLKRSRPYLDTWLTMTSSSCLYWKPLQYEKRNRVFRIEYSNNNNNKTSD